jgi:hypothetical protein
MQFAVLLFVACCLFFVALHRHIVAHHFVLRTGIWHLASNQLSSVKCQVYWLLVTDHGFFAVLSFVICHLHICTFVCSSVHLGRLVAEKSRVPVRNELGGRAPNAQRQLTGRAALAAPSVLAALAAPSVPWKRKKRKQDMLATKASG